MVDNLRMSVTTKFENLKLLISTELHMLDTFFLVEWPKLNKQKFNLNFNTRVGGWIMKLKIFIGFIQCFCYFPVIFDIPWPPLVLSFMKMLEFGKIIFSILFIFPFSHFYIVTNK